MGGAGLPEARKAQVAKYQPGNNEQLQTNQQLARSRSARGEIPNGKSREGKGVGREDEQVQSMMATRSGGNGIFNRPRMADVPRGDKNWQRLFLF